MSDIQALGLNQAHIHACHERWMERNNRRWSNGEVDAPDEWYQQQCGCCRYYIPLQGLLQTDWGVCSNAATSLDGRVMFEHDGCDAHEAAEEWVGAYYNDYEISLLVNHEKSNTTPD